MNSVNELLLPFNSMNDACIAIQIIINYETMNISTLIISKFFKIQYELHVIEKFYDRVCTFKNVFPMKYIMNNNSNNDLIRNCCEEANYVFLKCPLIECQICNEKLLMKDSYLISGHLYYLGKPSIPCKLSCKLCKFCQTKHFLSYYQTNDGIKKFYSNACNQKYITFSNETIFETLLLHALTYDIMYKHCSFKNYCASHNAIFKHTFNDKSRG